MTCDDCQAIVIDIARGDDVDRVLRDEARRHAALCPRCGEQQQEQAWLTAQLRGIAEAEADLNAPERVEIAALAAWRASYSTSTPARVVPITSAAAGPRVRRWLLLPSVAMTSIAAAAIATIVIWPPLPVASSHAPQMISAAASTAGTSRMLARNTESRGASIIDATPEATLADAGEADTDFQPLPYVEPLRATEARHVMRVSMTSGDEMILGMLPADRNNGQPFEADVLVGEDGIARAIRVVR
jgi:hypothetical protein